MPIILDKHKKRLPPLKIKFKQLKYRLFGIPETEKVAYLCDKKKSLEDGRCIFCNGGEYPICNHTLKREYSLNYKDLSKKLKYKDFNEYATVDNRFKYVEKENGRLH